ncbi:ECF transporter S component [Paucilactobacillus suebicus]|nr:ECF transporter S component [Paucilactobacillus suebicus]
MNQKRKLHVRDIILLALIGILFGAIFIGTDFVYNALTAMLTPFGLAPMANDLMMGLWVMAGPLAGFMIRIPGTAFLGEFLASVGEMFFGGQWGAATLISGVVQGIATELGFTITRYRYYNWITLTITTITTTILTFGWDMLRNGYAKFDFQLLIILFVARLISTFIFGGVFVKIINGLLSRAHVLATR